VARAPFTNSVSERIWDQRYRYRADGKVMDADLDASRWRVSRALASAEPQAQSSWAERFHELLADFMFLPGGRILAGAGTRHRVTLFNCFVMGVVPDSLDGILTRLRESALTLQQGGGIGCDFPRSGPPDCPRHPAATWPPARYRSCTCGMTWPGTSSPWASAAVP